MDDRLSRRSFLTLMGASAALASACTRPDRGEIVPYARPRGAPPAGVPADYASAFQEGFDAHSVLVRTREGRPILVGGNDRDPVSPGKAPLRAIADILGLYDPARPRTPSSDGRATDWDTAWSALRRALEKARSARQPVLLLTEAVPSPTRRALLRDLRKVLPGLVHAAYEPWPAVPRLRLERADVVAAFEADILGGEWRGAAAGFASRRGPETPKDPMSRLYVLEGRMSMTGSNADLRLPLRPSGAAAAGFAVARELRRTGVAFPRGMDPGALSGFEPGAVGEREGLPAGALERLAADLRAAGPRAAAVAGPVLPPEARAACALINAMLGSEVVEDPPPAVLDGAVSMAGLGSLLRRASRGEFAAAVFWGANPGFCFPDAALWKAAAAKVPFTARIGPREDETAKSCRLVLPEHHWLESWGDFEPEPGLLLLRQPAVEPLYPGTRQGEDILLRAARELSGKGEDSYLDYLKARWSREVLPAGSPVAFDRFWDAVLDDGILSRPSPARRAAFDARGAAEAARSAASRGRGRGYELVLHPGTGVHDGRYADNGWLQELPDPVAKLTWGNALAVSEADAGELGLETGRLARVEVEGAAAELPVIVQPGQARGVVSVAFGYGRRAASAAAGVGTDVFPLAAPGSAAPYLREGARVSPAPGKTRLALSQVKDDMEGRALARSVPRSRLTAVGEPLYARPRRESLYGAKSFPEHKWSMAVDLSLCIGCGVCVIACQAENNVPVVGPEQVRRGRVMHWMRVDRYYEAGAGGPRVLHQPLPCQHCDDAPCESVCPVFATSHNDEGINQMVYNRCVGTRYCANNCPYKVRKFNYFENTAFLTEPESLVFNPEVMVRPRGVMEKCTFCIQRIQNGKIAAKAAGRPLKDGDIVTNCAAACPTGALVFGDLNDPASRVARLARSARSYKLLEELGVRPSVTYLARVRNAPGDEA